MQCLGSQPQVYENLPWRIVRNVSLGEISLRVIAEAVGNRDVRFDSKPH